MWDPLEEALNARGVETIAYDASGTGQSPARLIPQPMTALARQAARLLDALGHRRADVLGISFGGAVAQELAISHPRPRPASRPHVHHVRARRGARQPARPVGPRRPVAFLLTDLPAAGRRRHLRPRPRCREEGGGTRQAAPTGDQPPTLWGYLGQLAAAVGWTSLPRLARIQCPTLVLAGEADTIVPPANSRILASRIRGARLEIVARRRPSPSHGSPRTLRGRHRLFSRPPTSPGVTLQLSSPRRAVRRRRPAPVLTRRNSRRSVGGHAER